jgi:Tfp pilus assembly protein PilV
MKKNTKNAFTIVETLVTLLAITIMIAGPLTFLYRSYNYSLLVESKMIATGLSQEGLELSTSYRNQDLNAFKTFADYCSVGCMIDWDGVSSTPTYESCDEESCRLYKSSTDNTVLFRKQSVTADTPTEFYRKVKFTANGTHGYVLESIAWSNLENIKAEVNMKKYIFNISIK